MKKRFKPRARMLLQLGDQLIKNENIAIVELAKNSYDADANKCMVSLKNIDRKKGAEIIIHDDGIGMTPKVVNQIWLEPGADFKDLLLKGQLDLLSYAYTAQRTPIGEKGIGRFGVHKLGDTIEMVTKSAGSEKEVFVKIDWKKFSEEKYLENAKIDVVERVCKTFKNGQTGTRITIYDIREEWTSSKYKDLARTLNSLNAPFKDKGENEFEVVLKLDLENKEVEQVWKEKILTIDQIKELSLWRLKCLISDNEIKRFKYQFIPYPQMNLLKKRTINEQSKEFSIYKKILSSKGKEIDLSGHEIGEIELEMYVFYLGNKIIKYSGSSKVILNKFLKENGGIRVYRDGMRVYNYGEKEDDWLNLDQQRVSNVGGKIGNKLILGAISLDRKTSKGLIEKTNREGFIENLTYDSFKQAVLYTISVFNVFRNNDKEKIRELYEVSQKTEPVLYDIDRLKDITRSISKIVTENKRNTEDDLIKVENDIFTGLEEVKRQYLETHEILVRSAGAGLNLSVVIHEIEKRMKELGKVVSSLEDTKFDISNLERVKKLVFSISKLIENYSTLVSNKQKKTTSLKKVIEDAIFNTHFRFEAHSVEIMKYFDFKEDPLVLCTPNIIVGALLNIFDNSLHWLNSYNIKTKKISIDFIDYREEVGLLIADNGKGFTISAEDAVKPFISKKIGGTGLGLHIANEMMKLHHGKLLIRDAKETKLPKEFSGGAVVELIFKKENEPR